MRAVAVLALAVLGLGCKSGDRAGAPTAETAPAPLRTPGPEPTPVPPPSVTAGSGATSPYVRDIDRICNVETYARADDPGVNPALLTAQWLGANLETQEARDFLAGLSAAAESDKAGLLDAEAVEAGLGACPTARKWDSR